MMDEYIVNKLESDRAYHLDVIWLHFNSLKRENTGKGEYWKTFKTGKLVKV